MSRTILGQLLISKSKLSSKNAVMHHFIFVSVGRPSALVRFKAINTRDYMHTRYGLKKVVGDSADCRERQPPSVLQPPGGSAHVVCGTFCGSLQQGVQGSTPGALLHSSPVHSGPRSAATWFQVQVWE